MYIYYVVTMKEEPAISISGPVPIQSPLIYNPCRREEAWRYLSYALIHIGCPRSSQGSGSGQGKGRRYRIFHVTFNVLTQLVLGLPLELVHSWRVLVVYVAGILAGSLAVSVTDPQVYLAGASGGVYALIAAHVANLVVNWNEMEFAVCRLLVIVVLVATDVGVALYNRYALDKQDKVLPSHLIRSGQ